MNNVLNTDIASLILRTPLRSAVNTLIALVYDF